jgi:hypothetical protein
MNDLSWKIYEVGSRVLANNQTPWEAKPCMPPGFEAVGIVFGWGKWVALVVAVSCLIAFFARLTTERQSGGAGSVGWLGKILIGIFGISGIFGIAGMFISSGGC